MIKILKRGIQLFIFILVSPLILITHLGFVFKSEELFEFCGTALSLIPGKLGSYVRVAYYFGTASKISQDIKIGFGSFFSKRSVNIGDFVYIGEYCIIGSAIIKEKVLIASRVSVLSGKHQHGDANSSSDDRTENLYTTITIGRGSWIGEGAILMDDVGDNCIIGSGSVVTRKIPDNTVAVGNPAKIIKQKEKKPN